MTTQAELIVEVTRIIQDSSYDDALLGFLNQAVQEVAGDPRILLPELESQANVSTSTSEAYADLPATYQKNLFYCYNSSKYQAIKIYGSLENLQRRFQRLDLSGTIVGVAVRGVEIHYQRTPSTSETLQLHFYRLPVDMDANDATPDGIPAHLARPLLVHHTCAAIFSEIEQDLKGTKVNTVYHEGKLKEAMAKLIGFIGPVATSPKEIAQEIEWESYL